jgi:hypothetical protein
MDIPVLVERSRSGNGAHLWVLFSRPLSARVARAIGSLVLTRAMRRRSISMASYDRLFPNQDTMPAERLALIDAIRMGDARVRGLATSAGRADPLEPPSSCSAV